MRSGRSARLYVLASAVCTVVLTACGSGGGSVGTGNGLLQGNGTGLDTHGRLGVVAGENFWGNIASQIGGDKVAVTSIITNPNDDPHQYETDVNDAAALASASVVIENGAGYDDFLSRLIAAGPSKDRTVLIAAQVVGASTGTNPHLWYHPGYVLEVAQAIERALVAKLPGDASELAANLAVFDAGEHNVSAIIAQIRTTYAGTAIAYTERLPGYLVQAAGLSLATPPSFSQAIQDGNDPSPMDNAAFETALTSHKAKLLLYNAQVSSPITEHIKQVARASGVPVLGISETIPTGEKDFQTWQADQARAILAALGG